MAKKNTTGRIDFSSIEKVIDYPDFLDVQIQSFRDFLQIDTPAEKRQNEGLFKVFAENMEDEELSKFYLDLMVSEANHYVLFLNFARTFGERKEVDKKWNDLLVYEAELMKNLGDRETIHG